MCHSYNHHFLQKSLCTIAIRRIYNVVSMATLLLRHLYIHPDIEGLNKKDQVTKKDIQTPKRKNTQTPKRKKNPTKHNEHCKLTLKTHKYQNEEKPSKQ